MKLAHPLERVLSWLIDMIVLILPRAALVAVVGDGGPGLMATFLCDLLYFSWLTSSPWQASVGQRLLSIHVVHDNGRPLSKQAAVERFLAFILPFLPVYASFLPQNIGAYVLLWLVALWFIPIIASPARLGLHDLWRIGAWVRLRATCGGAPVVGWIA